MANELVNVLVAAIASFILGMVVHSALGHTYGKLLWRIFHKYEKPTCYGKDYDTIDYWCTSCDYQEECERLCLG